MIQRKIPHEPLDKHRSIDMRVFPAYLQGGCAYRPYSPDSRRGSGTARARAAARRHPAIDGGQGLASAASKPDWVTERLTPGQSPVRRTAPGSSRGGPVRRQARRAAPRRNPAPERHSAPVRQRRTDTIGAPSLPSANARPWPADAAPGSGPDRQDSQRGWTTCKCGNSHWQEWPSRRAGW